MFKYNLNFAVNAITCDETGDKTLNSSEDNYLSYSIKFEIDLVVCLKNLRGTL